MKYKTLNHKICKNNENLFNECEKTLCHTKTYVMVRSAGMIKEMDFGS